MSRPRKVIRASVRGTRLAAMLAVACAGMAISAPVAAAQMLALRGTEPPNRANNTLSGASLLEKDPMATRLDDAPGFAASDTGAPQDTDDAQPALRTTLDAASPAADYARQDPFAAANRTAGSADARNGTNEELDTASGAASTDGAPPSLPDLGTDIGQDDTASGDLAAPPTTGRAAASGLTGPQDAETTGTIPARSIDRNEQDRNSRAEKANQRTQAIEGLKPKPEDDPYAALGIRGGGFILRPSLETGLTATSNANSSPGGKSAILSESTLRLNAASDWSDKTATIQAYGSWRKSISGQDLSEPSAGIDTSLEVPLGNDFVARGTLGYSLIPESPSSPGFPAGTHGEPLTHTVTGSLGLEKRVGKLRLGLTGNVERATYGDADLVGGGTASQHDRDSTLVSATLRTGYEISPALIPFVEAEIGRRYYDLETDSAGYRRSADRLGLRAGIALDLGDKLRGEFSAGYLREKADDPRLPAIAGPSIASTLNWSPMRGTIVTLNSSTTVESSTSAGESGSLLYSADLSIERQMRTNLTGTASIGGFYRDYIGIDGRDVGWDATLGFTYWLNRYFGVTGRLRHEELASNLPDRDYKTNSVFLGVKVQR
ncbi:MAG: outer membrane beta-barrel protein [Hyphomicrobiales bacterium]|nr:outer membrane beta-barrel protein [Hyphomicrobiales bacterium]